MAKMYQLACDVYHYQLPKGVAEHILVKQIKS
jgi:hypothetical protein